MIEICTIISLIVGSVLTVLRIMEYLLNLRKKKKGKTPKQKIGDMIMINEKIAKLFEEQADFTLSVSDRVNKIWEVLFELSREIEKLKDKNETMESK
jgi:hypothetical protein